MAEHPPYRGSDNEKARKPGRTVRQVKLVPRADVARASRPPLLPGRRSRRPRQNVWVPA